MIVKTEILDQLIDRGRIRLIFQHLTDAGEILGPFVERRGAKEDVDAFVSGHAQAFNDAEAEKGARPPSKPEDILRDQILAADDATIKAALAIDDAKLSELKMLGVKA